jgi:hypothetical protein
MDFTNSQINPYQIPQSKDVILQPIEPTYLKVLQLTWLITFGIILIATVALFCFIDDWHNYWAMGIAALAYCIMVTLTVIIGTGSFKRKSYAVREHDILYKNGWIFQDFHVVPFNRIQHVVVNSGPIDRKFKLASLTLYTAAAETGDISIPGLQQEAAEQLKSFILQHINPAQTHEGLE